MTLPASPQSTVPPPTSRAGVTSQSTVVDVVDPRAEGAQGLGHEQGVA